VWLKIIIVVVFIGIIISLASGLFFLVKDKGGDSKKMVRALTFRISLSLGLFIFLLVLMGLGVIKPHGLYPENATTELKSK
tara:strand:+ start:163 stop:405 length:243 start_codon:yes stop_codon:yes gene_type:complete